MAIKQKIDSRETSVRWAWEESIGVLPTVPVWNPAEPNSYDDFGGEITTVRRRPISESRQNRKGTVTDLDANGGLEVDVTQDSHQDLMQAFLYAAARRKKELTATAVGGASYTLAAGGAVYLENDLLFAKNFVTPSNNGLKLVTASTGTSVSASGLAVEATGGIISHVGFQFATGDAEIDASGDLPQLTTTTKDLTTLGLIPGEWVWLGGDTSGTQFNTAANNGWARVRSIAANVITFDKTRSTMVTDDGDGKTLRIFFGRVMKNESNPSLIVSMPVQWERTLGTPDTTEPTQFQSEYLIGSIANELEISIPTADKITSSLMFMATDHQTRTGVQGRKTGTRPSALREGALFNSSSDVKRIKLSRVIADDAAPSPLFAFVTELTITVNNNVSANKAVGVLGAFDMTAGQFDVEASMTAYFSTVEAIQAVRDNADVSLDIHLAKNNAGISIDLPLVTLGDGQAEVEIDEPITLPLSADASSGADIDINLNHTILMVFWDYLPDAAMV
jgi:hypothetical protein